MRPIHSVVLLLAGALGGALIMTVAHPAKPAMPMAVVAQAQPPTTVPPESPSPAVQAPPAETAGPPIVVVEPAKPSPMPPERPVIRRDAEPAKPSPMPPPERPVVRREALKPQPTPAVSAPAPVPVPVASPEPLAPSPPPLEDPVTAPVPVPAPPTVSPEVSAAPAPQPHQVTLNAGMLLPVRLVDGLSSERNVPGDAFAATLDKELVAEGFVIAERGARVEGRVVAVDRAKLGASAALALELIRLHTSDGQMVAIRTENYFKHADPSQVNNTTKIAGGAIIGAAIGAMAGGGKGAAIGAGIGGGAGAGDVLLTRGKPAELSSEMLVMFKLKSSVPLTEKLQ